MHVLQRGWNDEDADPCGDEGKRRHHVGRFLSDAGAEARCTTRGNDTIAPCPRSAIDNESLPGERLQKDSLSPGERMALRQSHDPRLLQQWMKNESSQFGEVHKEESGIEPIAFYGLHQASRTALGQRHGHPWKGLAKLADDARDQWMKSGPTRIRHRDSAFLASRRAPCGFKRSIEVGEGRMGGIEERAAGVGDLNAARHAAEQLHLDVLLNRLNETAERWLRDAELLCSPGDVPFFGDCDETAEMPQFHS